LLGYLNKLAPFSKTQRSADNGNGPGIKDSIEIHPRFLLFS